MLGKFPHLLSVILLILHNNILYGSISHQRLKLAPHARVERVLEEKLFGIIDRIEVYVCIFVRYMDGI